MLSPALKSLAELQRRICDSLRQPGNPDLKNISPGSITTIAARARAGQSAPKVQVPRIDRYFSLSRERLFGMVNALFWEQMPNRHEYGKEWHRTFKELLPPDEPDPDGIPIAQDGLNYLKGEIERNLHTCDLKDEVLFTLHRALEQLLVANRQFAVIQQKEQVSAENYRSWRMTAARWIGEIMECTRKRFITAGFDKDTID